MGATLLMIDFQQAIHDDLYKGQKQGGGEQQAAQLLNHWRAQGEPVVHLSYESLDPHSPFAVGQKGAAFIQSLAPLSHEVVIERRTRNGFIGTDLMQALEEYGSSELVICGAFLQHGVESTARMASDLGFMVFLVGDACISLEQIDFKGKKYTADEIHALTLGLLEGHYVKVVRGDDLINTDNREMLH